MCTKSPNTIPGVLRYVTRRIIPHQVENGW